MTSRLLPQSLLAVEGITCRFGGLYAVRDVSLTIGEGELVGLIGPNGAGKTTLFNIITGFTHPTAGRVLLRGKRIDNVSPHTIARKGVARTFQNLRLFSNLTAFENVAAGAAGVLGFSASFALFPWLGRARSAEIEDRTWSSLRHVDLEERAQQYAATLSYGQKKYLEIARALAIKPDLLILDEPAAGLNETETEHLIALLRRLNDSGLTIILVEHDMNLVMNLCRRLVVLAAGQKIADGSPAEIRDSLPVQEAYLGIAE